MLRKIVTLLMVFARFVLNILYQRQRFRRNFLKCRPKLVFIHSNRKPHWVVREIIRYKALMPQAGARRIADLFNRRFAASKRMTVSKSYVAYTLRREAHRIADQRRAIRQHQAKPGNRNIVWGIDLTGKQSLDDFDNPILGILDHGTRRLLCLDRPVNATSWTLLGHLFLTIGRYGKPKAVRTDNGSVFVSRLFQLILHFAGIAHQRTEPGCPWMNGRIERLFGTLKKTLNQIQMATTSDLSFALSEFSFWYNRVRPHQNLDGRTPYEEWHGIDPYAAAPGHIVWFSTWDGLLTGFLHRR